MPSNKANQSGVAPLQGNPKMLSKEIEENTKRRKLLQVILGRINVVKMVTSMKASYKLQCNPMKITMAFSTELEK